MLGVTYDVHLRLIGKLIGTNHITIIELFSLGAFVLSQYPRLIDRRTDGRRDRQNLDSNTVRMLRSRSRNIAENSSDNLPSYPADSNHSLDVCWREKA